MKLRKFLFILAIFTATALVNGCVLFKQTISVVILDTDNGRLDVEAKVTNDDDILYIITATPDDGYELLLKNIFVCRQSTYSEYISVNATEIPNQFSFKNSHEDPFTVSARFTKIKSN